MKTIQISDELYQALKKFLVDPFDDTPDIIIGRLVEIAQKAQNRWSAWDSPDATAPPTGMRHNNRPAGQNAEPVEQPVVL